MPEPLIHFIIPFFLLLMSGLNVKKAILFSMLAILPDLDVLFHIHRSFSHSIIFILLISALAAIVIKKFYKEKFHGSIIATLVILSHPFMDAFTGYTPVFWPLFNKSILIVAELTTNMNDVLDINLNLDMYFKPVIFYKTTNIDTPIFSSTGVAVSLVLLAGLALKYYSIKHYSLKPPSFRP